MEQTQRDAARQVVFDFTALFYVKWLESATF